MKRLFYFSVFTMAIIQLANAQPNDQKEPVYLAGLSLSKTTNTNTGLVKFATCDKINSDTEFSSEGITINPKFELKNAAEKKLRATAYFYYAEDTPMPAFHKGYSTSDLQLATWKDVQFCEDALVVNGKPGENPYQLSLFMPYNKMGLDRQVLSLKYFVALFDGDEKIQESDWIFFRLDSRKFLAQEP